MNWRQLGLVGAFLLVASAAGAQATDVRGAADSTSMLVAIFRTAIVHGQLTAHGSAIPQVICLARRSAARDAVDWRDRFAEPDSMVVAQVREREAKVRPKSACRIEEGSNARTNKSNVVERATGRHGIMVWVADPERDANGTFSVHVGYYEQGLSAAEWVCAIRQIQEQWVANACRLLMIS